MRKVPMIGAVVVVIAGVVLAGGYVHHFPGLRSAPRPLALNSPLPAQPSVVPSSEPAATMTAFGISPPALPITAVDPAVTVEVQVFFAPGA